MSATAVLVPVLEPEAEALVSGGDAAREALQSLTVRGERLRARVAAVDAIREELHLLLFPRWQGPNEKPPGFFAALLSYFQTRQPARRSQGYDPFVHLFGRSLPVAAPDSALVAKRLADLLALEDDAFLEALGKELALLDPAATKLRADASLPPVPLSEAVEQQATVLSEAMAAAPPAFKQALDTVVRLSAWTQPVWRFDGEFLPDLLRTLGIGVEIERAVELFEPLVDEHPAWAQELTKLPVSLGSFDGAGAWLSSTQVKVVAGTLRLQRGRLADNASLTRNPALVMRHLRLLEEAIFFCEANGLALCEASGVEWHER